MWFTKYYLGCFGFFFLNSIELRLKNNRPAGCHATFLLSAEKIGLLGVLRLKLNLKYVTLFSEETRTAFRTIFKMPPETPLSAT